MVWVSLEEAEPIPDISWGVRVLQPPPEQENKQYGEPGRGPLSCLRLHGRSWDSLQEAFPSPLGTCSGCQRGIPRPLGGL